MAHRLIASFCSCCMGMDFDMRSIYHQPLVVGIISQGFQYRFPSACITPTREASVCIFPTSIIRGKVSPGGACSENPKNSIDKKPIILGYAAPRTFTASK